MSELIRRTRETKQITNEAALRTPTTLAVLRRAWHELEREKHVRNPDVNITVRVDGDEIVFSYETTEETTQEVDSTRLMVARPMTDSNSKEVDSNDV